MDLIPMKGLLNHTNTIKKNKNYETLYFNYFFSFFA